MSRVLRYVAFVAFLATIIALARPSFAANPDCGENTGQKATGKPIPIGVLASITGLGTTKESTEATKAYFDCVNANGGIHGRPIVYLVEDDQGKVDVGAQVAKKLVHDDNVYAIVGGLSASDCVANSQYYAAQNIVDVGQGIALQCFQSRNMADINAGARQGGIAIADYARRKLGAKSIACWIPKYPGADYICGGVEQWGQKYGVKVTSFYGDPSSIDASSVVLQILASGADAAVLFGTDDIGAQLLNAAEEQDGAAKMKWLAAGGYYTARLPGAINSKYWNNRFWVNLEFAPLDSKGADNQNWLSVLDAYGGNTLRDTFSQASYVAARFVVRALLTIKNPEDINRNTVTAAIQNAPPYSTDILCRPWYWGGADAQTHNANHTTRTAIIRDGHWREVEGCQPDPDPGLAPILATETKLGISNPEK